MKEFFETFFEVLALMIVVFVVNVVALGPVVLSILLGDVRYLALLFVSVPFVAASLLVLTGKL